MNAVNKIFDVFQSTIKYAGERHQGEFGIEIETERDKEYEYPKSKFWRCVRDGSLRKFGVEYVLKCPVDLVESREALDEFSVFDKKYKFDKNSVSTSVHVHVNMLNDTFLTLANFLTAYALVEPLLIRYSGPDRLSNLFCLPFNDAEATVPYYTQMLSYASKNAFGRMKINEDTVKYSALNCAPLTKIGTVEIRSFRGETDVDVIFNWLSIIMKLKTYSRKKDLNPIKILELWRSHGVGILDIIFEEFSKELRGKYSDKEIGDMIREKNQFYAAKFATSCKDWNKFGIVKIKPVYHMHLINELTAIAREIFQQDYLNLDFARKLVVDERYTQLNNNLRIVDTEGDE